MMKLARRFSKFNSVKSTVQAACVALAVAGCSSSNDNQADLVLDDDVTQAADDDLVADAESMAEADPVNETGLINQSNFDQQLRQVVQALNLEDFTALADESVRVGLELERTAIAVIEGDPPPSFLTVNSVNTNTRMDTEEVDLIYSCANGGSITQDLVVSVAPFIRYNVTYDSCLWVDENDAETNSVFGGTAGFQAARRAPTIVTLENFQQVSGATTKTISGVRTLPSIPVPDFSSFQWTNANYEITDAEGTLSITDFNYDVMAKDGPSQSFPDYLYTLDLEGQVQRFIRQDNFAELTAGFRIRSSATDNEFVDISVDLAFDSPYYTWTPEDGAEAPPYPMSELGGTFEYALTPEIDGATLFTATSSDKLARAQWQTGNVTLIAVDGTSLSLSHSLDDPDQVIIEFNGSGNTVSRSVADGYQVACPARITGCGDAGM